MSGEKIYNKKKKGRRKSIFFAESKISKSFKKHFSNLSDKRIPDGKYQKTEMYYEAGKKKFSNK